MSVPPEVELALTEAADAAVNKRVIDLTDFEQVAIAFVCGCEVEIRVVDGFARVATKHQTQVTRKPSGKWVALERRHDA